MKHIKNTWAVILGGSSGLGLASAKKLAAMGYHICLVHRSRKSALQALAIEIKTMEANGIQVHSYNLDALKEETIQTVLDSLPTAGVSVLLHSIAKGSLRTLNEMSLADLQITTHAMALSWWQWTQALIRENKFASVAHNVAFTSEGNQKVWKGYGAVSVAKASLEALMRQMAVEYASEGLTTNCIQAGATRTPSFDRIPGSNSLAAMAKERNPFKKLTTPEAVANVVAMLVNSETSWVNGTIIKADGGESLR